MPRSRILIDLGNYKIVKQYDTQNFKHPLLCMVQFPLFTVGAGGEDACADTNKYADRKTETRTDNY